jgi:hypothetical protein
MGAEDSAKMERAPKGRSGRINVDPLASKPSAEPHVIQTTRCAGNRDKLFHRLATPSHRLFLQKVVHSALHHVSYHSVPILLAGDTWDQVTGRGSHGGATPVIWAGEG